MDCTHCGRDNPNHVRYCLDCGTPIRGAQAQAERIVAPRVACRNCAADNPKDAHFCRECGNALHEAAPSTKHQERLTPAPQALLRHRPTPAAVPSAIALQASPAHAAPPAHVVEQKIRTCRACGSANGPIARFCQICGLELDRGSGARPRSKPPQLAAVPVSSMPEAELVVIAQDGSPGRRFPLHDPITTIGQAEHAGVSLKKDPYVSPEHARLSYRNGGFDIEVCSPVNGVFVRIGGSLPLQTGDLLLLGLQVLRFEAVEEIERSPSPALRAGTRVFGTPATPRYGRLSLVTVEERPRDVYYLSRAETILGREQGDIVFTDDPFMSRRHASLRRDPNTNHFTLRDLGSSNGTFVAIRGNQALSHGDHVRIGQHLFRLDVKRGG